MGGSLSVSKWSLWFNIQEPYHMSPCSQKCWIDETKLGIVVLDNKGAMCSFIFLCKTFWKLRGHLLKIIIYSQGQSTEKRAIWLLKTAWLFRYQYVNIPDIKQVFTFYAKNVSLNPILTDFSPNMPYCHTSIHAWLLYLLFVYVLRVKNMYSKRLNFTHVISQHLLPSTIDESTPSSFCWQNKQVNIDLLWLLQWWPSHITWAHTVCVCIIVTDNVFHADRAPLQAYVPWRETTGPQ